jgi:hypothetical protein
MNAAQASHGFFLTLLRALWLLVWTGLALLLAFTLWIGFVGLVYPYELLYGEGIVLWFAKEIAHGHAIYKGLLGFPFSSSNYPPLAMLLSAVLMPVLGEGYVSGRLLNFASALIVAALIYRIVRAETGRRSLAACAALFFVGSPYIYNWVALFRVDLIGLAFAFGGVFWVWKWERKVPYSVSSIQYTVPHEPRRERLALLARRIYGRNGDRRLLNTEHWILNTAPLLFAGCCFLLAGYTKQSLLAAPAAAFLAIWRYSRKLAVGFAVAVGAVAGIIYLSIDAATGGGFTFGLITSNATVFLWGQLAQLLASFAITFPILILFGLWGLATRARARQFGVLEWYAIVSMLALVMAGRMGAWENYFFEAIAALCVVGFASTGLELQSSRAWSMAVPILLLVQLALMWHDPRIAANQMAGDAPANRQLAARLAQTPGPIIAEDMGALVTSGKDVGYYTFQYSSLARSGQWDQSWELNGLRDGLFPLVILEQGTREDVDHYRRFTREFVSALDRYYAHTETIGKYDLFTPAPLAHIQAADYGDSIGMIGWSMEPANLQPGAAHLTIVWQARRSMRQRYTAFVHLEDATGKKIAQDDREPHHGFYPTTQWAMNEMVREDYMLNVPEGLAHGHYTIRVGWYDSESGDRLPVPGSEDNTVVMTTVEK